MASNASHMLEAALEQMDDIIAGKSFCFTIKPSKSLRSLKLQSFIKQVLTVESYQERLSRLEGDKESLILQVSVLTDQVEAQWAKISDLQSSLLGHQHKLNSTEEMLQQELLHRTSLENQKLNLLGEVSYLKLKLADMEGKQGHGAERQHKAETVVNFISELQEQMCRFQKEINSKIQEKKALELEMPADSSSPVVRPTESTKGGLLKELRILKDKVEHLEDQKLQYEKKLKATKVKESSDLCGVSTLQYTISAHIPLLTLHSTFLNAVQSNVPFLACNSHPYRLRRTQSGGLQAVDPDVSHFRRGGLRATAGPRLTRTPESYDSTRDMNVPFSQWTKEQVCGWLEDYGLGQYVNLTRQWVENGQTLLSATPQDFEKEMGMKNPLHRKKLQLALKAFTTKVIEKSADLDYIWVTRWLDDIGLPQYKDHFHEARVDGRMIQYITVNDLLTLKVTSQLHHLSIKCAIHVLHANKFNPNCLRRRPGEEKQPSPSEVVQWSNHRVMEWLRAVDLAEYAPNLRGSGVHGGLIILEPRFSAETLALLLNIPPQKTLLRRHLATAFSTLVGHQATQEKREYGNATGHMPLTTTAKVKPKKLGFTQFSHLRKRKPDESADYICPIDSGALTVNGVSRVPSAALRGLGPALDRQAVKQEQVGIKAQTNGPKQ
uniref:PPFIA binding protein 2 n=1 Tax=Cyclopterus lumpus TaxID=8103 RepID=A0A8C2WDI9_CYCLU